MSENKVYSILGICKRANMLVSGELACEKAIRAKQAKLIIIAEDCSKNTEKKFKNSSEYYNVKLIKLGTKETIGKALGNDIRAVAVILDDGFSKKITDVLTSLNNNID